jgi:hypothetical protein
MIATTNKNMHPTEAFPLLSSEDKLAPLGGHTIVDKPRIRRRSSGLGGEIRAGDTSAPALATLDVRPPSPGTIKVSATLNLICPLSRLIYSRRKLTETHPSHSLNDGKRDPYYGDGNDTR